jgi:acyl-CoA synthetase (AMP-forming)/AMP-acid ligase II
MSVKWAIKGFLEEANYYIQGIPRFFFVWKDEKELSIDTFFQKNVAKYPEDTAFIFNDKKISWLEADQQVNKFAAYLQSKEISKGDCFAMLMDNSADFLMLFFSSK